MVVQAEVVQRLRSGWWSLNRLSDAFWELWSYGRVSLLVRWCETESGTT